MRKSIAIAAFLGEISAVKIKQMAKSEIPVLVDIPGNFLGEPYNLSGDFGKMDSDMARMN